MDGDSLPIWLVVALLLLVSLNGFFVAAEAVIRNVKGGLADQLAKRGGMPEQLMLRVRTGRDECLYSCQLGMIAASIGLGWSGAYMAAGHVAPLLAGNSQPGAVAEAAAFLITIAIVSGLLFPLGWYLPKAWVKRYPLRVTSAIAGPFLIADRGLHTAVVWLHRAFDRLTGGRSRRSVAESSIERAEDGAGLPSDESGTVCGPFRSELALAKTIFSFSETHAREIMIPRTDIVCLYADLSYKENYAIAMSRLYARYPVCDPDKDHVIGFVHLKDLLLHGGEAASIRDLVRPLLNVPESMPIRILLHLLQANRTEIALLIDEYGGTSGIVTVKDMIERIVGDIRDEFDVDRPRIERIGACMYSIDGMLLLDEVNGYFGMEIESDDCDTIGGWVSSRLEALPGKHECVRYGLFEFLVEEVEQRRVARLTVKVPDNCSKPFRREVS